MFGLATVVDLSAIGEHLKKIFQFYAFLKVENIKGVC
jgi:hypothetical protein